MTKQAAPERTLVVGLWGARHRQVAQDSYGEDLTDVAGGNWLAMMGRCEEGAESVMIHGWRQRSPTMDMQHIASTIL